MALEILQNEIGGREMIDTEWNPITRDWYDRMSAASNRPTFEQTDAFDKVIKALYDSSEYELIIGTDSTGKLWYAKISGTETVGYTDGINHVEEMPEGWTATPLPPVNPDPNCCDDFPTDLALAFEIALL